MLTNRVITSIFWGCLVNAKAESLLSLSARDPVTGITTLTSLFIGKHWIDSFRADLPVSLQEKPGTTVLYDFYDFYDFYDKSHNVEIRWQQKQQITLCSQHSFMMYALPDGNSPDIRLQLLPFSDQAGYCTKILLDSPEGFARFFFDSHQASVNPVNSVYTLNDKELPLSLLQVNTAPDLSVSDIDMTDRKQSKPHLQLRFSCDLWPAELNTNCKTLILDSRHYKVSQRGGNGGGTSGNGKGESNDKQDQQQPRDKETKETNGDKGGSGRQGGDASGGDKDPPEGSGSGAHKKINTSLSPEQAKQILKIFRKLLEGVNQYNAQSVAEQIMGQLSQISSHNLNHLFEAGYSLLHDVITSFPSNCEPLIYQLVASLLENDVNALALDHQGNTAFHLAASQGLQNVFEHMLNVFSGHDSSFLNYANSNQYTPLMLAAMNGHHNIVTLLITHQAKVSQLTGSGFNAMHLAAQNGHAGIVEVLSEHMTQVQIDCPTSSGQTALHLAAQNGHVDVIKILRGRGANPNTRANNGNIPVGLAIYSGHVDATRALFDSGAVVKDTSPEANVWKESMNKPELFEVVFARCANEPEQSCHETEAIFTDERKSYCDKHTQLLFVAVKSKWKSKNIRIIATQGNPDLNKPDTNGRGLLHLAVDQQDTVLTRTLLELGADINMQTVDDNRDTVLHLAEQKLNQELVKILLEFTPDLEVVDGYGHTVFSETVRNLRKRASNARSSEVDSYDRLKPGHSEKYIHILELLANAGANVEHRNKQGKAALSWLNQSEFVNSHHLKTLKEIVKKKKTEKKEREAAQRQEQKRKEKERKDKEREEKRKEKERKEQKQRHRASGDNNLKQGKTVEKETKL